MITDKSILEKAAIGISVIALLTGAWFWSGQLNDVLEFLALAAEAEG